MLCQFSKCFVFITNVFIPYSKHNFVKKFLLQNILKKTKKELFEQLHGKSFFIAFVHYQLF